MDTELIHENGVEVEVTEQHAHRLDRMGLLYKCDNCALWHITPGFDWCDIDLAIIQMEMEDRQTYGEGD